MILQADARRLPLAAATVQSVVTSPPYWGLRDYKLEPLVWGGADGCEHEWGTEQTKSMTGQPGLAALADKLAPRKNARNPARYEQYAYQTTTGSWCQRCGAWRGCLGLEPTPDLYVQHLVGIFREVRRVLRDDGTVWLNLGDSYTSSFFSHNSVRSVPQSMGDWSKEGQRLPKEERTRRGAATSLNGLKPKDLIGLPWMVAFALRADGWYLRSDIIWAKGYSFHPTTAGSCMPESVTDRPTRGHEYVFLLTKSARYYYDAEAVKEPATFGEHHAKYQGTYTRHKIEAMQQQGAMNAEQYQEGLRRSAVNPLGRNLRSVWLINPEPFSGAHFATFPEALVEPCLRAGSRRGDLVLDPFVGSGTVVRVAYRLGRRGIGCDLNLCYLSNLARERTSELAVELPLIDETAEFP